MKNPIHGNNGSTRRDFNRLVALAFGGVVAGAAAGCGSTEEGGGDDVDALPKHACKGMNECKNQGGCKGDDDSCKGQNDCKEKGGCATVEHHDCRGKNECKGLGGCGTDDHACAGNNACEGKGGCAVPVKM